MCRDRGITASNRDTRQRKKKSELIECLLNSDSRASDQQMGYMVALVTKNHRLVIDSRDIDSKNVASKWIAKALKTVEVKGGRPEDVKVN